MARLHLQIVTPEGKSVAEEADCVVIPTSEGEIGILPQHSPLMTIVEPGELRIILGSTEKALAVGQGFAEIGPERVRILTAMAMEADEINEEEVEAAMELARKKLDDTTIDSEEMAAAEAAIARSIAALGLKRRKRQH